MLHLLRRCQAVAALGLVLGLSCVAATAPAQDWRNIRNGLEIPSENYADQPYIVQSRDGNNHWLAVVTTGIGNEGALGQHVVATSSTDQGRTWSPLVDIEPATGPESSWAVPLITDYGRVYAFYTYNDLRDLYPGDPRLNGLRLDTNGVYAYRYSDDFGQTWSQRRELPYRKTSVDLNNSFPGFAPGEVNMFWGVNKPFVQDGNAYFAFTKIGTYFLGNSEGWVFKSDNVMTETDVSKVNWELVPAGDFGIKNPAFGSVQEEHVAVPMNNGGQYMVYRTTTGFPAYSISTDGGRSWSVPERIAYSPGGSRLVKNSRANIKVWRTSGDKYLMWFVNNGTTSFENRNPAWLSGGIEIDGNIHWSQPEIVLYDPTPRTRFSYPDFLEHEGRYWITETNKTTARTHELDPTLLDGLWNQFTNESVAAAGRVIDLDLSGGGAEVPLPPLPSLIDGGLSLDFWVKFDDLDAGQILADNRDSKGKGFVLRTTNDARLELFLNDGSRTASWNTDFGVLGTRGYHHVAAIVDGAANVITFVVDGNLLDGGGSRAFGWTFFDPALGNVNGAETLRIGESLHGRFGAFRVYDRYLRTSEAVGNFNAFTPPPPEPPEPIAPLFCDGTYYPYIPDPPEGQTTWNQGGALLTPTVNGTEGHLRLTDSGTGGNQRIEISHVLQDISDMEWTFEARLDILSASASGSLTPFALGVRDEGGTGRAFLLMWFKDGLYFGDNSAGKNGNSILITDTNYIGDGYHTYRVEKKANALGTGYTVQVYVDGEEMFDAPLSYTRFAFAASTTGFGYFGSSPGTSDVLLDYMELYMGNVPLPGDLNGDGLVGSADLDLVRANWGASVTPGDLTMGDASGDGLVDSADLDIVRGNWGQTTSALVGSVPEPTAAGLLLMGLLWAGTRRRIGTR